MKKHDVIVIGMGPAGMAISAMGAAMGLKVLGVEKHKVGGECLNCGCIPSKALLKAAEALHGARNLEPYGLHGELKLREANPMEVVRRKVHAINDKKLMKAFERVELVSGEASFEDPRTVRVGEELYTAKKIFIATGTKPFIPPIPGLNSVPGILTNTNMFEIEALPESLTIIGGGAIGTEMAQAFSRLGTKVTVIHMDPHLVPLGDEEAGALLQSLFEKEGITVRNGARIDRVAYENGKIFVFAGEEVFTSERLLVAAGRSPVLKPLDLEKAGVAYTKKGIAVDDYMRTNVKNIYAVGDCNGQVLLSHAAMHQGMLALMHALSPFELGMLRRSRYYVPWGVFTDPEVAQVGLTEKQAREKGISFEVVKKEFRSYGRTVADGHPEGFIKVILGKRGKILGATVVGESASELIQEWTLALQYKKNMFRIMMTQHAFPSVSMINKMVAEQWMMGKMQSPRLRGFIRFFFR